VRGTHFLEMVGGTYQDKERNRPSKGYSRPGDGRGMDLSGYGKKAAERGELTSWRRRREKPVRVRKETDRARGTHFLETAVGGACQDTERNRLGEGHSRSGDGLVRTQKKTDRAMGTHKLETAEKDLSGLG
jgi:hypothetical protein